MREADRLWEFAKELYARPGVEQACLKLQARYGISVSLTISTIWAGLEGYGRIGNTDTEAAIRRASEWDRDVIEPLRALRRHLKRRPPTGIEGEVEALRRHLLDGELEAERLQQRLFLLDFPHDRAARPGAERWRDAAHNVGHVVRRRCPTPDPPALEALATILAATGAPPDHATAVAALRSAWPDGA